MSFRLSAPSPRSGNLAQILFCKCAAFLQASMSLAHEADPPMYAIWRLTVRSNALRLVDGLSAGSMQELGSMCRVLEKMRPDRNACAAQINA